MRRAVVAVAAAVLAWGSLPAEETAPKKRPKVVLVLSGGGARGAAHVGVIRVLEEYHVPVDMIVGTSMGSIVGGLYASGWSIEEIEQKMTTIDWGGVFVDTLPRKYRTFRRKSDDARFLIPIKMRFKNWKPYLPPAVLGGQSMELLFKGLEMDATGERDFDKFPIPYRAVASNFATGECVVLDHGSLSDSMRASMSLPGLFPPVEIDGHPLADGGMAANFPVRVAKGLGAEVVIGVDISTPLRGKAELGNILTRLDQVTGLLTNKNKAEDMAAVTDADVIMVPELGEITAGDFDLAPQAIEAGVEAARAQEARLRALSVSDAEWDAYKARLVRRPVSDLVVDEVKIVNTAPLADELVAHRIKVPIGEPLDQAKLSAQLLRLYSLDAFGPIRHNLVRENGRNVLTIETPPKPYSRNSLQFGFNLEDNFQGDSAFNLSVSHLFNPMNRRGGEWRNLIQIGENELISSEFYQPFDVGMKWFVMPEVEFRRDRLRVYDDEGDALAEYRIRSQRARLSAGRVLGEWGAIAVGAFRTQDDGRLRIGSPVFPSERVQDGGLFGTFQVDTLDRVTWPRDGTHVSITYGHSMEELGADAEGNGCSIVAGSAATIGKNILFGSVEVQDNFEGNPSLNNVFLLGGFLRLSGLANNELIGDRGGFMRLLYYRELTSFSLGALTQRMYAGLSLEGGNVYNGDEAVTWPSIRRAGSLYVGADTVLGPVYLAFGYAEGNRKSVYLSIGQRF